MTTSYSQHLRLLSDVSRMPVGMPRSTLYTGNVTTPRRPRATSLTRQDSGSSRSYTPSASRPTSRTNPRPLPKGPGPLDSAGKKLDLNSSSYKIKSSSNVIPSGPLKADYGTYKTSYNSDYGSSTGKGSSFTSGIHSNSSSRPSSGTRRRSTSLANLNDSFTDLKTKDEDYKTPRSKNRDEVNGTLKNEDFTSSRNSSLTSKRTFEFENDKNEDVWTPRSSKINSDKSDDIYSISNTSNRRRDASLPPIARRDSSPLDAKPSFSRQTSPTNISNSRYSNGGKVGLRNLGNTCFMNSVLQCLSNTKPLLEYFLNDDFMLDKNTSTSSMKGHLVTAYANLLKSMWVDRAETYVSPNSFKTQIQRFAPRFMGYAQQDAQEFLRYLLEGLHEDVNKVTSKPKPVTIQDDKFEDDQEKAREYWRVYLTYDNSRIVDIFVGQLKSELKFDCGHRSVTFDPFWDLSVPIPKSRNLDVSINQCLGVFMKEEVLDADERPTCSKCKKRISCTKSFSIQRFPRILVLHLKRFSQGRYSQKVSTSVDFPLNLDMSEYSAEKGGKRVMYSLYGISNHSGGVHSGHYTANCKHPYSGDWSVFNDTRVSPTSASRGMSSEAYVLFYERSGDTSRL